MITLDCSCGTKLRVRDDAAGKKAKCPKCAAIVPVPEPELELRILEESPGPAIVPAPAFAPAWRPRTQRGASAVRGPVCWEAWTVLLILGFNLLVNIFFAVGTKHKATPICGIITGMILMAGIHARAAWAWWWAIIASVVSGILSIWVMTDPALMRKADVDPTLVGVQALGCLVIFVALLVARFRGSYVAK